MEHSHLKRGPSFALQSVIAFSKARVHLWKGVPSSLLQILSSFRRNKKAAFIILTGKRIDDWCWKPRTFYKLRARMILFTESRTFLIFFIITLTVFTTVLIASFIAMNGTFITSIICLTAAFNCS